ncbi:MAG: glycerol kinase GlpK [Oligoflexia bacterium]|nr:glycerol kinase GlpK [Oligoflexia bacterium]
MSKFILAIDQGTTATTAIIFDTQLNVVAKESVEILPTYPKYGWVEVDLQEIWTKTLSTIEKVCKKIDVKNIQAIGITNQRETVGGFSKKTGVPYAKAIVWQCRRTTERCKELNIDWSNIIKQKTGLVLDPYFSATKIEWLLKNNPSLLKDAQNGEAIFSTIDSYLLFMLSGKKIHATDTSNASRTMLVDIKTNTYDKELLDLFGIREEWMPKIMDSNSVFAHTLGLSFLPDGIPISGILGDQQAALFGQQCFSSGESKLTFGTGSFLVLNTGEKIVRSNAGLISTVAWTFSGKTNYALEGSCFVSGAAVQFIRDNLGLIKNSPEIEALALGVNDEEMGDVLFVPSLTGLGAPHWEPSATGIITGLTRGTTKAHIARATLEGIAFQNADLISAMNTDLQEKKIYKIRVDGGASANNLLMQIQADFSETKIERPEILETTALGAAMMAGLGVNIWQSKEELKALLKIDTEFLPKLEKQKLQKKISKWKKAIEVVKILSN